MGNQPSSTLAGEEDRVRVLGLCRKSWKILIGVKGSLKSSQLASGGEEHVDGTGPRTTWEGTGLCPALPPGKCLLGDRRGRRRRRRPRRRYELTNAYTVATRRELVPYPNAETAGVVNPTLRPA